MLKKIYDAKDFIKGLVLGIIFIIMANFVFNECGGRDYIMGAMVTVIVFTVLNYLFVKIVLDGIFESIYLAIKERESEEDELI